MRLAGIEPTTPWFVAKYSIQLSYSRLRQDYSRALQNGKGRSVEMSQLRRQYGTNLKSTTYSNVIISSSSIYEGSFAGGGVPGNAGKYTTVPGTLLATGGMMSGRSASRITKGNSSRSTETPATARIAPRRAKSSACPSWSTSRHQYAGGNEKKPGKRTFRVFSLLLILVRLAGIEPTTPWFVAKYSIQLSYSRKLLHTSPNGAKLETFVKTKRTSFW